MWSVCNSGIVYYNKTLLVPVTRVRVTKNALGAGGGVFAPLYFPIQVLNRSRDSSVSIATGYRLDGPGLISDSPVSRLALGLTQPPIQWVPGVKRPGREADHSPPSSTQIKNGKAIPPLPYMSSWHSAWLIKHRDSLMISMLRNISSWRQHSYELIEPLL
jgi:hypothetical protein